MTAPMPPLASSVKVSVRSPTLTVQVPVPTPPISTGPRSDVRARKLTEAAG